MKIHLPTLNDGRYDFLQLFDIWRKIDENPREVIFDFSKCRFLQQNAVAFLGGLARLIEERGGKYQFLWDTLQSNIHANLAQNGFIHAFSGSAQPWKGNSIPYREDTKKDHDSVLRYLRENWLDDSQISLSDELKEEICERVVEIYMNAFEHSESHGVFSCGQYYPNKKELSLAVADFGIGIPSNVKRYFDTNRIRDEKALEWAFRSGKTTKRDGASRGLGLDLLREFVQLNTGRLDLYSNAAHACINEQGTEFSLFRQPQTEQICSFSGTVINISLKCDERHYRLASEIQDEMPVF